MADFEKFENESSSSSSSSSNKSKKNRTPVAFDNVVKPIQSHDEFRNEHLDYNFRKSPFKTWLKMIFPHFSFLSVSVLYAVFLILIYILELVMWINNYWS